MIQILVLVLVAAYEACICTKLSSNADCLRLGLRFWFDQTLERGCSFGLLVLKHLTHENKLNNSHMKLEGPAHLVRIPE